MNFFVNPLNSLRYSGPTLSMVFALKIMQGGQKKAVLGGFLIVIILNNWPSMAMGDSSVLYHPTKNRIATCEHKSFQASCYLHVDSLQYEI